MHRVRIVGTGVAGLTLALALCRAGIEDLELYSAAAQPRQDPGLLLSPNATRILNALGLADALLAHSIEPLLMVERAWRSGYLLTQRPLGSFARQRYGAPHLVVAQSVLEDIIRAALRHYDVAIHDNAALPSDSFTSGDHIVVGCDGSQSQVRQKMGYPSEAAASGHSLWRARIDQRAAPRGIDANAVATWIGPRQTFTLWPAPDGTTLELMALFPTDAGELDTAFAAWHSTLGQLIAHSHTAHTQPLLATPPVEQRYHGNWVLLGEACQQLHPYLQQQTAMALEDAWVLARMLDRWEEEVPNAFRDYERYRNARVKRLTAQTQSRWQAATQPSGLRAQQRNLRISLMNRFLPEMSMQQLDWLYGYDCIAGFE
mgnify:CR=1 FL=1